jgi:hypothetical protein
MHVNGGSSLRKGLCVYVRVYVRTPTVARHPTTQQQPTPPWPGTYPHEAGCNQHGGPPPAGQRQGLTVRRNAVIDEDDD